ncbi:MAG: transglutaminase domain-containing protein [Blautia sp.]|jgi:hypothetical protein
MKKKMRRLLAVFLFLTLIFTGCQAKEKTLELVDHAVVMFGGEPRAVRQLREAALAETDGIHQEYYFKQLNESEQRVYREILKGVEDFQEEILVTSADDKVLERAYGALLRDHGELFWIHGRGVVYKTLYRTYGKFEPQYGYTKEEAQAITQELTGKAKTFVDTIGAGATDYEKAKAVYAYVIQNVSYQTGTQDQNIAGALYEGSAVCAGYARAVQYLLEMLDVECIYVSGDMKGSDQGHAWNLVNLDGDYYYLDATNGDQQDFLPEKEGEPQQVLYDYFCPYPTEYEVICQPDDEFTVPECTAVDRNLYVQQGSSFSSYDKEELRSYLMEKIDEGTSLISVKYQRPEDFAQARADWIDQQELKSMAVYYMEVMGVHQIQYSYGILEDFYTLYFMF